MNYDFFDRRFGAVFPDACHGLFRGVSLGRDAGGATLRACCPKGMERGSATRSSPECRTGAGNSMGFRTVERAAAHRAALRRRRNRFGQHALDTITTLAEVRGWKPRSLAAKMAAATVAARFQRASDGGFQPPVGCGCQGAPGALERSESGSTLVPRLLTLAP